MRVVVAVILAWVYTFFTAVDVYAQAVRLQEVHLAPVYSPVGGPAGLL
jgi:hypothetical protein